MKEGQIVYLQAKYFDGKGQLISPLQPDLMAQNIAIKHFLHQGDVIFAAKGTKNFAALYEGKDHFAVASTSFFVIRIREPFQNKIIPEYLVWFINNPITQNILKSKAMGTSIVSISKSVLEELEISIPDLQTQRAILKITQLRNSERNIKSQIETLREKQIQQQLLNAITSIL